MSNEIYNRGILQLAIERFDYPENISLVGEYNWPDLEIKDKSVVAKFIIGGDLVTVEFMVWSQYNILTGSQHAKTIYPVCFGILENYRINKAKELVKLDEIKKAEKAKGKMIADIQKKVKAFKFEIEIWEAC
jgi:hypothetical protein